VLYTAEVRGSRLTGVLSSVRLVTKRLGLLYAPLWMISTFGRRLSLHVFIVTTHPVDDDLGHESANTAAVEARLLTDEDVVRFFDRDEGYGYSRPFAADALSRGDRCVGLLERGRLLWYCWYARGPAPVFDDAHVECDRPFLYAYNVYTDPASRGRGLHELGVRASACIFAREGYRALTAYIEASNLPPLMAARKMRERFVGCVFVHRGRGAVQWFATRGCTKAGFRMVLRKPTESSLRWPADEDGRASA
jgi:hypothetical protein